jgi:hypothetical protein
MDSAEEDLKIGWSCNWKTKGAKRIDWRSNLGAVKAVTRS